MRSLHWLAPLLLACRLAAQDIGTSLIAPAPAPTKPAPVEHGAQEIETSPVDPAWPVEVVKLSPFWENEQKPISIDPFSTVTTPPKLDLEEPPGPPYPVMTHTMVFRTEDRSVVLEAMAGGRESEAALFARLLAMEAEGTASIAMEEQITTLGGRAASTSIIRSAIYPTEWEPLLDPLRLFPTAFETRQLGDSVSITPRFRNNGIHALAQAASVRWADPTRWPLLDPAKPPGTDRMIFCLQPQILVDECTTTALVQPGATRLLGITQEARAADDTTSTPAWRFAFLRPAPIDDTRPPSEADSNDPGQSVRCDVLVFRLPLVEAAEWVTQPGPRDDAAAWEALMSKARTGEVTVTAQWSVAAVTGPVRPGGPPEASLQSLGEFIYPTEHDRFTPTAFETRNTGTSCRLRLRTAADGRTLVGQLHTEEVRLDRLRRWPSSVTDPDVCLLQPEFIKKELKTDLVLPADGITFLGLRDAESFGAAAAEATEAMADLYFVKSSTDRMDPTADAPQAPPIVEWRTLVFSVDDAAATELEPLLDGDAAATGPKAGKKLWRWVADGRAHVRHAATMVVAGGGRGSVTHLTDVIYPTAGRDENGLITFKDYETQATGLRLGVVPTVPADRQSVTAQVEFGWASAPPRMPEFSAFRQAVDSGVPGSPLPEFFDSPEQAQKSLITLPAGTSRLLRLEKARAPAGSPDHGRWHALLVGAAIGGA